MLALLKHKKQPAINRSLSNSPYNNRTVTSPDMLLGRKHCVCILFSSWLGCCKSGVDNAMRSEITPLRSFHQSSADASQDMEESTDCTEQF